MRWTEVGPVHGPCGDHEAWYHTTRIWHGINDKGQARLKVVTECPGGHPDITAVYAAVEEDE